MLPTCVCIVRSAGSLIQVQGGVGHAGRVPEPQARQAPRQAPPARLLSEEVVARHRRRVRRRDHWGAGQCSEIGQGGEGGGEEPGARLTVKRQGLVFMCRCFGISYGYWLYKPSLLRQRRVVEFSLASLCRLCACAAACCVMWTPMAFVDSQVKLSCCLLLCSKVFSNI